MLNAQEIYHGLLIIYGKPRWWSDDPFTVMFQSVLVQNTAWSSVEKTCTPIGDKMTPEYIGSLRTEELEQLISPCGFYKAKARTIQALVSWYRSCHFDRREVQSVPMPDLRKELLSILLCRNWLPKENGLVLEQYSSKPGKNIHMGAWR